jgi:hypothetical protein
MPERNLKGAGTRYTRDNPVAVFGKNNHRKRTYNGKNAPRRGERERRSSA